MACDRNNNSGNNNSSNSNDSTDMRRIQFGATKLQNKRSETHRTID